jgi:hypothetical protein
MMGFYRFLSYIKLWELYEKQAGKYADYDSIREDIISKLK